MKRLLDCDSSDIEHLHGRELLSSIRSCEGRVMAAESIGSIRPLLGNVTNAEFCASMGADILVLNLFDALHPHIEGMPDCKESASGTVCDRNIPYLKRLKMLTGRVIAVNLEPVPESHGEKTPGEWEMTEGRRATVSNVKRLIQMGADMIVLTGNPGIGVTNSAIIDTIRSVREAVGDQIIIAAGKMHASGIAEEIGRKMITKKLVKSFCKAGADIIVLPAPGTTPEMTQEYAGKLIKKIHKKGKLAMTAVGTSQEGADRETIRQIALMAKMAGADIHHIGDTGYMGMALPENIFTYSKAIRGVRHTYRRMASSVRR